MSEQWIVAGDCFDWFAERFAIDSEPHRNVERAVRARLFAVGLATVLVGAASGDWAVAAPREDPFEHVNRKGFAIQKALDRYLVGPLGYVFGKLTPGPIGKAIHNILVNLSEPTVVINDVLQMRPARAGAASVRFAVNSTLGLAGMIDVAGKTGLPHHLSSFGDTLGRYGVGPGPYLFIPMVGPSTVRDLFGNVVDAAVDPLHFASYPARSQVSVGVAVVGGLDQWTHSEGDLRALLGDATDPYATLRSTYLQHREAEVEGLTSTPAALPDLDTPDTPASPSSPSPSATLEGSFGGAADQPTALRSLPDRQDWQAHDQFPRAFDERERDGDVRPQAEQGTQDGVAGFLHADPHGGDEDSAANGHYQSLEAQYVERPNLDPGQRQSEPGAQTAGDPGSQMDQDRE